MARREFYTGKVRCPNCGTAGTTECSEVENPAHNNWDLDKHVSSATPPFEVRGDTVFCGTCNVQAKDA